MFQIYFIFEGNTYIIPKKKFLNLNSYTFLIRLCYNVICSLTFLNFSCAMLFYTFHNMRIPMSMLSAFVLGYLCHKCMMVKIETCQYSMPLPFTGQTSKNWVFIAGSKVCKMHVTKIRLNRNSCRVHPSSINSLCANISFLIHRIC